MKNAILLAGALLLVVAAGCARTGTVESGIHYGMSPEKVTRKLEARSNRITSTSQKEIVAVGPHPGSGAATEKVFEFRDGSLVSVFYKQ